jgi:hypothetical protein
MNIVRQLLPWVCLSLFGAVGVLVGAGAGLHAAVEAVGPKNTAAHETALIGFMFLPWYLLGAVLGAIKGGMMGGIGGWVCGWVVGWGGARWWARRRSST